MSSLPIYFNYLVEELPGLTKDVEGHLSEKEIKFLALLAACPTAKGEVLEIGSFRGKSTIVLAKGATLTDRVHVVAVDPLSSPSITDPHINSEKTSLTAFRDNLKSAGVEGFVEFHQKYSSELAGDWNRKIRLLWIDGDHTLSGTKTDFSMFSRFLSDGAIVAIQDVLHGFEGCISVFMEDILLSDNFGPAGVCGSLGWGQYFENRDTGRKYMHQRNRIHRRLKKLRPLTQGSKTLKGFTKIRYKILRWRVPHSDVNPLNWLKEVTFNG